MEETLNSRHPKKGADRSYQFEICLGIALSMTTKQIQDALKERYRVNMSIQNIDHNYRHAPKWRKIIDYLRRRYLNNISRIPIANKGIRLAYLQEALNEAMTLHVKTRNQFGEIKERRIGLIPAIVREARLEVEGEKGVNIYNQNKISVDNYKSKSDEELVNYIQRMLTTLKDEDVVKNPAI